MNYYRDVGSICIKKGAHDHAQINGQNSKRFDNIPNQIDTVFCCELKIIDLRVYPKKLLFHIETIKGRMEE